MLLVWAGYAAPEAPRKAGQSLPGNVTVAAQLVRLLPLASGEGRSTPLQILADAGSALQ
jgi:hypothetical protein